MSSVLRPEEVDALLKGISDGDIEEENYNNNEFYATFKKEFSKRLRVARAIKGWFKLDLSKESGIHCTSISQYEKGNSLPSAYNVIILCKTLNITPNWLLGIDKLLDIEKNETNN